MEPALVRKSSHYYPDILCILNDKETANTLGDPVKTDAKGESVSNWEPNAVHGRLDCSGKHALSYGPLNHCANLQATALAGSGRCECSDNLIKDSSSIIGTEAPDEKDICEKARTCRNRKHGVGIPGEGR